MDVDLAIGCSERHVAGDKGHVAGEERHVELIALDLPGDFQLAGLLQQWLEGFQLIVGDMLVLAAAGIVAGVGFGAVQTRYLQQMLFGVTPLDPAVFIAMPVALAAAVLAAALLSAGPALSVAPLAALRHE